MFQISPDMIYNQFQKQRRHKTSLNLPVKSILYWYRVWISQLTAERSTTVHFTVYHSLMKS